MKTPTKLIHHGREPGKQAGFVNTPVYRGSTMLFSSLEELENPPLGYGYGRNGSPAQSELSDLMCELENGAYCKMASCGLSAITGTLLSLVKAGEHILVPDSVFYPTRHFCNLILKDLGVETSYYDPVAGSAITESIRPETSIIFLESPGSNTFELQDVAKITSEAKQRNIITIMDNTWATPLFFRPLDHGVDISIHAATKYITGHSDALLGVIIANERLAPSLNRARTALGLGPGSEEVNAALKGLRTLAVRLERHQENGLELAQWLETRDEVERLYHPALPSFETHEIWKRDFTGASGLFSFLLKPCSDNALKAFLNNMKLFGLGWSWGGFESLIVPLLMDNSRTATGWSEPGVLIRIHAGLEHIDDLKADLEQGFARMNSVT